MIAVEDAFSGGLPVERGPFSFLEAARPLQVSGQTFTVRLCERRRSSQGSHSGAPTGLSNAYHVVARMYQTSVCFSPYPFKPEGHCILPPLLAVGAQSFCRRHCFQPRAPDDSRTTWVHLACPFSILLVVIPTDNCALSPGLDNPLSLNTPRSLHLNALFPFRNTLLSCHPCSG